MNDEGDFLLGLLGHVEGEGIGKYGEGALDNVDTQLKLEQLITHRDIESKAHEITYPTFGSESYNFFHEAQNSLVEQMKKIDSAHDDIVNSLNDNEIKLEGVTSKLNNMSDIDELNQHRMESIVEVNISDIRDFISSLDCEDIPFATFLDVLRVFRQFLSQDVNLFRRFRLIDIISTITVDKSTLSVIDETQFEFLSHSISAFCAEGLSKSTTKSFEDILVSCCPPQCFKMLNNEQRMSSFFEEYVLSLDFKQIISYIAHIPSSLLGKIISEASYNELFEFYPDYVGFLTQSTRQILDNTFYSRFFESLNLDIEMDTLRDRLKQMLQMSPSILPLIKDHVIPAVKQSVSYNTTLWIDVFEEIPQLNPQARELRVCMNRAGYSYRKIGIIDVLGTLASHTECNFVIENADQSIYKLEKDGKHVLLFCDTVNNVIYLYPKNELVLVRVAFKMIGASIDDI
ncbi:hypothetical protein PCE1_001882 [Barthelona sp. PCE]